MIVPDAVGAADVDWPSARRIIRSVHPPIDLFEDIADPADWPLLISAEQKTNPRLMETIGTLDLVPPERRVGGPGASYLMAPFTHVSRDRPSRFSDGSYGVLYVGDRFEVALFETIHHHGRFMAATREPPGWTSQFREIIMKVSGRLHDLRPHAEDAVFHPDDYANAQVLGAQLRRGGAQGVVYRSVRFEGGDCAGLFYPDLAADAAQGRHLDYHWNGSAVDFCRDRDNGAIFQIV
nr:RES family NAD+ phosphorylase [Pararhizobium haloflavum]